MDSGFGTKSCMSMTKSFRPPARPTIPAGTGFGAAMRTAHIYKKCGRTITSHITNCAKPGNCSKSLSLLSLLGITRTFNGWRPYTRIYYGSTHWATGIEPGPDGDLWYKLTSELWDTDYFVPRTLLRPIPDTELAPISPDVPQEEKRIEVNLDNQMLTAYEGQVIVFQTKISSGLRSLGAGPNGIPTATPRGRFNIQSKLPSKHMGQGRLTDDLSDPILLGVPWTAFFYETGVAFHGTYWHDNFGSPMSHGCINMRNDEAKWLFRWTNPVNEPTSWEVRARLGTSIQVI